MYITNLNKINCLMNAFKKFNTIKKIFLGYKITHRNKITTYYVNNSKKKKIK